MLLFGRNCELLVFSIVMIEDVGSPVLVVADTPEENSDGLGCVGDNDDATA